MSESEFPKVLGEVLLSPLEPQDKEAIQQGMRDMLATLPAGVLDVTGTTFKPLISHSGLFANFFNEAGCLITLAADLPKGFGMSFYQYTLEGPITFEGETGTTLIQSDGLNRSRTRGSLVSAMVVRNIGGDSAEWAIFGDLYSP